MTRLRLRWLCLTAAALSTWPTWADEVEISDTVSREYSIRNESLNLFEYTDAVSREYSIQNESPNLFEYVDAVSREYSIQNESQNLFEYVDAVSREYSVWNESPNVFDYVDAISREYTVVNNPVHVGPMADQVIAVGQPYTSPEPTLDVGNPPITWSLVEGPAGMTINPATGVVAWADPGPAGATLTVTIRAANNDSHCDVSWKLRIVAPPVIGDIADQKTPEGVPFTGPAPSVQPEARPVEWSLVAAPPGMTLAKDTGVASWPSPTTAGSPYTITIKAVNPAGSAEKSWMLTVQPLPVIADIPDATIAELVPYSVAPTLLSGTPPVTWSLVSGPQGLTVNPQTGEVAWQRPIGAASPYPVTIKVVDPYGSDTETWQLTVPITYTASVQAEPAEAPSGTPIYLTGVTTALGTGETVPYAPVTIRVRVQGTRRVMQATSNATGQFAAIFQPLSGEAGNYTVGADHPAVTTDKADDTFRLFGLQPDGNDVRLRLIPGELPVTQKVTLRNPGDTPLTGLSAVAEGVAENLSVQVNPPTGLAVYGTAPLHFTVVAADATVPESTFTIRVTSAEGAVTTITVHVTVAPLVPHLVASPTALSAGMLLGQQTLVQLDVTNDGGVTSEAVHVQIPSAPWLSLGTPATLPGIAPNGKASVVLNLSPALDLPLGPYVGTIVVWTNLSSVTVPFTFNCISDRKGGLRVAVTDEYTYWADGANGQPLGPKVAGASVTLKNPQTESLVASGTTGPEGMVSFADLTEAYYDLEVSAPDHGTFRTQVLVSASRTKEVEAFLPRQLVTYDWTVIPLEVEDEYLITVQAVFETHVPAPVITIDPPFVDLTTLGCDTQIDFTITNHGLIAAQTAQIAFGNNDSRWEITPLVTNIGDIPAQGTAVVPVLFHDRACPLSGGDESLALKRELLGKPVRFRADGYNPCAAPILEVRYTLICGVPVPYFVPVGFRTHPADCGGGGGSWSGGGGGAGGAFVFVADPTPHQPGCCDEGSCDCLKAMAECAIGFIPGVGCLYGLYQSCEVNAGKGTARDIIGCIGDGLILGCLLDLPTVVPILQCACNLNDKCDLSNCKPPCDLASLYDRIEKGGGFCGPGPSGEGWAARGGSAAALRVSRAFDQVLAAIGPSTYFYGDLAWLNVGAAHAPKLRAFMAQYSEMTADASEEGIRISAAERQALLALDLPVTAVAAEAFLDRWNRTVDYYSAGIYTIGDVPAGQSIEFIDQATMLRLYAAARQAVEAAHADGFDNPFEALASARDDYASYRVSGQEQGICARVKIRIDQQAVIGRSAFRAALELENGGAVPLEGVAVTLDVRNAGNAPSNDVFGINPPVLTNISDVSGTGLVAAGTTARAQWTLVPSDLAAPVGPTKYYVGGTLSYSVGGQTVTIPLYPAEITVLPNPSLHLKYFLEKIVYSDDPFTQDVVEPSIPFSLGLLMSNTGAGTANHVRITSGQPKIVENEKGLLIDFVIIGTKVGAQSYSPSLTVNLGDLGPGQTNVAQWIMTSSLEGKFIEFEATLEHVTALGQNMALAVDNDPLSLVDSLEIHPLTHVVRIDQPTDDGLPDFLADDAIDPENLPDALYRSDGGATLPVAAVTSGTLDGSPTPADLTVQLTASLPAGWAYLRVNNPGRTFFRLVQAQRADGTQLRPENFWITHRIVRLQGQSPYAEDLVHLLDFNGSGSYTLTYAAIDSDNDGVPDVVDLCPNTPANAPVDANGCPVAPTITGWEVASTHGNGVGKLYVPAVQGYVEPRTGGIAELAITFSQAMDPGSIAVGAVTLTSVKSGDISSLISGLPSLDASGTRMTVVLTHALPDADTFTIAVGPGVKSLGGVAVGGTRSVCVSALAGDVDGSRMVDDADMVAAKAHISEVVSSANAGCDVNGNGLINAQDMLAVRARAGRQAPACPVPLPPGKITRPVVPPSNTAGPLAPPAEVSPDQGAVAPAESAAPAPGTGGRSPTPAAGWAR